MTPDEAYQVLPPAVVDLVLAGIPAKHRRRRPPPATEAAVPELAAEPAPQPEPEVAIPAQRLAPYLDRGVLTVPPPPAPTGSTS